MSENYPYLWVGCRAGPHLTHGSFDSHKSTLHRGLVQSFLHNSMVVSVLHTTPAAVAAYMYGMQAMWSKNQHIAHTTTTTMSILTAIFHKIS